MRLILKIPSKKATFCLFKQVTIKKRTYQQLLIFRTNMQKDMQREREREDKYNPIQRNLISLIFFFIKKNKLRKERRN